MFAYARLRLQSADLAEDAVQDALAAAWRGRASFEGRSSERTWLIGILRYKVLDLIAAQAAARTARGRDPKPGADEPDGRASVVAETGACGSRWGRDADPARVRAALRVALDALPDAMREAVVLREVEGLSGKAVCEILGISETNLWTLVHRAKARMRVSLNEQLGDE